MAMPIAKDHSATANARFAATIINRAADIVIQAPRPPSGDYAFAALQQARDECLASEGSKANQFRAYSFSQLLNDLAQHIRARYPAYSQAIAPIGEWSRATPPETVAAALRAAAGTISRLIAQRAIMASRFEMMSDQESADYNLMRKAAALLTRHGLSVNIDWEREDTDGPIDYRGTVDGVPWAFALAQLRKDPNRGYYRKTVHPNARETFAGKFQSPGEPLPQIPRGADILQQALNKAVLRGKQESELAALNGAGYCLVIQNWQFTLTPDWKRISLPDLAGFDAVLILHQETGVTGAEVWQVLRSTGFNPPLTGQNVADLNDIADFKLPGWRAKAAAIQSAWEQLDELNLSEADFRNAVPKARGKPDV